VIAITVYSLVESDSFSLLLVGSKANWTSVTSAETGFYAWCWEKWYVGQLTACSFYWTANDTERYAWRSVDSNLRRRPCSSTHSLISHFMILQIAQLTINSTCQVDHHQPTLHHVPEVCVTCPLQELPVLIRKDSKERIGMSVTALCWA
jgi:hypothetical protein